MKNWLRSSQDPKKVSNTVQGAVLGTMGIVLIVARLFNFPLTEDSMVEIAGQAGAVAGGLWFLYGVGMKVVMFFGAKSKAVIKKVKK